MRRPPRKSDTPKFFKTINKNHSGPLHPFRLNSIYGEREALTPDYDVLYTNALWRRIYIAFRRSFPDLCVFIRRKRRVVSNNNVLCYVQR